MRIGIIGTGRHGSRYAGHIVNDMDRLTLAAISRRSESGEAQAREWGAAYYRINEPCATAGLKKSRACPHTFGMRCPLASL